MATGSVAPAVSEVNPRSQLSEAAKAGLRQLLADPPAIPELYLARCIDCARGDVTGERDGRGAMTLDACRGDEGETAAALAVRALSQLLKLRESWPSPRISENLAALREEER